MLFTVRQAREYAGLNQEQMASKLGIHRSTYVKIEKDVSRATVGQIKTISEVTHIPIANIFLPYYSTNVE